MDELIDEVDYTGKVIATHPKSYFKERMFLHKASLIIPKTFDNKYLLSKRAPDKHPWPGTWCCAVGGKAHSGETEEEAGIREMKEEIGKIYELEKVTTFVYDEKEYKAIFNIFTTKIPINPTEIILDPKEIECTKAFTLAQILRMVKETPQTFPPTFIRGIIEFAKNVQK